MTHSVFSVFWIVLSIGASKKTFGRLSKTKAKKPVIQTPGVSQTIPKPYVVSNTSSYLRVYPLHLCLEEKDLNRSREGAREGGKSHNSVESDLFDHCEESGGCVNQSTFPIFSHKNDSIPSVSI